MRLGEFDLLRHLHVRHLLLPLSRCQLLSRKHLPLHRMLSMLLHLRLLWRRPHMHRQRLCRRMQPTLHCRHPTTFRQMLQPLLRSQSLRLRRLLHLRRVLTWRLWSRLHLRLLCVRQRLRVSHTLGSRQRLWLSAQGLRSNLRLRTGQGLRHMQALRMLRLRPQSNHAHLMRRNHTRFRCLWPSNM